MVIVQFATGWISQRIGDENAEDGAVLTHVQLGLLLATVVAFRLAWRLGSTPPRGDPSEPVWRAGMAHAVHTALYALMIALPISGYILWDYGSADMSVLGIVSAPDLLTPSEDERLRAASWYLHLFAGWALVALVALHVSAAVWHQWVRRDGLLRRML